MATANHIQIRDINFGGIADSDYVGSKNSVSELIGLDVHSEPGVIKLNQALSEVDTSAAAIDQKITAIVAASNGTTYFFGASGKIWSIASGIWSLVRTASPAAGTAGILSAREYQGKIYYAMQSRLGQFDMASTWNDNFATFGVTDIAYHPMEEVNLVLYIGDGNQVAQVDGVTFSANALDLSAPHRVSALGILGTDLLIGTYVSSNVVATAVFRWNTWSDSFSVSDPIPEVGIYAFLKTDNIIMVAAGTKGNIYTYNGTTLNLEKTIKGNWSSTNKATVWVNAVLNFHGKPLFGLSQSTGTGVNLGVYSFARTNASYPYVLALEYPISTGNLTGIQVNAMAGNGDTFYVSWYDSAGSGSYGVDQLDLSNKYASGWFTTRISLFDRVLKSTYGQLKVPYRTLPANTSIDIYYAKDHGTMTQDANTEIDTDRLMVQTGADAGEAVAFQAKVVLNGNDNDSPEVEMLDIPVM